MVKTLKIYTDGACNAMTGQGGWSCVILYNGKEIHSYGGQMETTNNQMEIRGAIEGIKAVNQMALAGLFEETPKIKIFVDSQYVHKGITEWIYKWEKNNWKSRGAKIKNKELWEELKKLSLPYNIEWNWLKAHAGHKYNELADKLALKGKFEQKDSYELIMRDASSNA